MKEEKDDLEKSVESLRTALRQQEQSAGVFLTERCYSSIEGLHNCFQQTNTKKKTGTSR
jgi:hypothetical protein